MGVDYELICATLCTRSNLLVIHSRDVSKKTITRKCIFRVVLLCYVNTKNTDISSKLIILNTFSDKFQLGDQFISLIYTITYANPLVSAAVHTLAKKLF